MSRLCAACGKPIKNDKVYASIGGNWVPFIPAKLYHVQCVPTLEQPLTLPARIQLTVADHNFVFAVRDFYMNDCEFADKLGVSRLTIERWRAGTNLPTQAMRRATFEFIEEKNR